MSYLNSSDFNLLIQDANLQQIINQNEAIRQQAELTAIGEARSYLIQKYLFDEELLKTGTDRDSQLLNYIIDIALYHLHSRIAPRNIPELRISRYENAIAWLKMCSLGEVTPKLALQPTTGRFIQWGSNEKNTNIY